MYQGSFSPAHRGAQRILGRCLEEAFFDSLRTKQQMGYKIDAWPEQIEQALFQFFGVESKHFPPDELLERFESFLQDYLDHLKENIPEERFETLRHSVIALLDKPEDTLAEHAAIQHLLATSFNGKFHHYDEAIQALKDLTYEEFLAFSEESLLEDRPRIAVLMRGNPIKK
jgi:insulysin